MDVLRETLTRDRPTLQTRKALLLIDFQKEFTDDEGKFPVTVPQSLREQLPRLVKAFRESEGDIVWVKTAYNEAQSNDGVFRSYPSGYGSHEGSLNGYDSRDNSEDEDSQAEEEERTRQSEPQ